MNVMNYKLTPEQYAALHAAQETGVQFDSYLLAPGQRVWKRNMSILSDRDLVHIEQRVDNVPCSSINAGELAKAITVHGNEMLSLIKAQQYQGPAE